MLLCFFWLTAYTTALTQGFGCSLPLLLQHWEWLLFLFSLDTSALLFYKRHSGSLSQCQVDGHTLYSRFGIESEEKESLGQMSLSTWQFKKCVKNSARACTHTYTQLELRPEPQKWPSQKKKKKEEEEKKELASYLTSLCHNSVSYLALTISSMSFFRGGV